MPHIRNGHTWIANELIEQVFARGKFSKRESQIIWVILRESWGWLDKRPKTIKRYGKEIRKYSITHQSISYTQFSEKTGIAMPHIGETIKGLKARKVIREHRGYYKFNKNYDGYQNSNHNKEVTETVSYQKGNQKLPKREVKVTKMVTSTLLKGKPKKSSKALKESKEKKESIYRLFDFWNSLKIMVHRDREKFKSNLNAVLKDYSEKEIKDAMQNYKTVLEDNKYFWTHRWELRDFLQRGLDRFLTSSKPLENFLKEKDNERKPHPTAPYHEDERHH